jgi:AcrR family transcriptional regulator
MAYRQTEKTKERREERKRQIINSARKLFSEKEYSETTMNQIVKGAGTSIGNCYFYFPNKESLLFEIVKEIMQEIWDYADKNLGNVTSGLKKLAIIFYQSTSVFLENDKIAQLVIEGYSLPSVRKSMLEYFTVRVKQLVENDPSLFRGGHADLEIFASLGVLFSLIERKRFHEIDYNTETLGLFISRWNLQALGFSESAVENAMETLMNLKFGKENKIFEDA